MSPEQKAIVKETWQSVGPMADTAVGRFYDRLFEIDPTTRLLFRSANMPEQRQKIVKALTMVVHGLDRLETLVPSIESLGRRHALYGVTDHHYDAVGAALLWMLENTLGSAWTPEVGIAWSIAYSVLADIMKHAAHQSLEPAMDLAK